MTKKTKVAKKENIPQRIKRKYGIDLPYDTDEEIGEYLDKIGVPSLRRLLGINKTKKIKWKKIRRGNDFYEYNIRNSKIGIVASQDYCFIKINTEYHSLKEAKRIAELIYSITQKK